MENLYSSLDFPEDIINWFDIESLIILILDIDKKVKYINKSACSKLGILKEDIIGKNWFESFACQNKFRNFENILDKILDNDNYIRNREYSVECKILNRERKKIQIIWHNKGIFKDGEFDSLFCIGIDVTQQRKSERALREGEALFRNIVERAKEMIITVNQYEKISSINPACLKILGYKTHEILNQSINIILTEEYRVKFNNFKELVNRSKERMMKIDLIKKNGHIIPVEFSIRFFYRGRKIIGFQAIGRDISKREKFEAEKFRSQKIESISLLAGGIAHDFNNILMTVLGNVNLLQLEENLNSEQKEILKELEEGTLQARNLTKQLLSFSKGGTPVIKPESLESIIRETAKFVMRGSNSRINYNFEKNLPLVNIDAGQFSQIINNLLINAKQAMPKGGLIKIECSKVKNDDDNDRISIENGEFVKVIITDFGIGIPKNLHDRIFEPYFTTKKKGNGLGLATCYKIVKNHRGFITFKSEAGKGTSFIIYIPSSIEIISNKTKEKAISIKKKQKILILDDNLTIQRLLQRILKKLGHKSKSVFDGHDVIQKYTQAMKKNDPFNIVILDLTIPGGLGGKDTVRKLKKIDPNAIVIAASGYSNDAVVVRYKEYGFDDVLKKPFTITELKEVLNSVSKKTKM